MTCSLPRRRLEMRRPFSRTATCLAIAAKDMPYGLAISVMVRSDLQTLFRMSRLVESAKDLKIMSSVVADSTIWLNVKLWGSSCQARHRTGDVVLGDAGESDRVTGEVRERSARV